MRVLCCGVFVCWAVALNCCVAQIPAFSGAEGPGALATGGRGGDVYHVTNLEFDKDGVIPGSLKYGINQAPSTGRTIVFDVGGTIYHDGGGSNWWFRSGKSNITIAGQTAPGAGITIAGVGSKWTGDNIILRNITVRPNKDSGNPNNFTYDGIATQATNSIIDHVSVSWYTDEGVSATDAVNNTTVQYAMIAEGLNYNGHSYGSIINTNNNGAPLSYHHNLYAHNSSRMPRLGSETSSGAVTNFYNNVIYNWTSRAGYSALNADNGAQEPSRTNFINNFYALGANRGSTIFLSAGNQTQIYQSGNLYDGVRDADFNDAVPITWSHFQGTETQLGSPLSVASGVIDSATAGRDRVLDYVGANWQNRNPIDQRIIDSVSAGTGAIIADLTAGVQATEWATVLSQQTVGRSAPFTRESDWDTDRDGLPGYWEVKHGLDPDVAGHNGDFDDDGYTDLEEYINEIAEWPAPSAITFNGATNSRYAQITNWDIKWQPSRFDTAVINQGTVVVDAVGQHAGNVMLGVNPGDNATLNILAGWLEVENADYGLSDGITVIGDDPAATATLNLSGGALRTETLLKGPGGAFHFTGGVLSADTVGFDLVNDGGTMAPGLSPGATHVMGDLTILNGSLQVELAGQGEGEFDSLLIDGSATLGGTLELLLLDGFTPDSGSSFPIVEIAGSRTGEFDGLAEGALVGNFGVDLYITYAAGDGNDVALFTLPELAGDFNEDGNVDAADFLIWQRNPAIGNLLDWQASYGGLPATAVGLAVPEPSNLALLLMCLARACCRTRD